jgi:uncharacterized protein YbjT (DUF2867 family)
VFNIDKEEAVSRPTDRGQTVVIFGSTGTAGSGAVQAALGEPTVSEVRAITRRPLGFSHPKLVEVMCSNFSDLNDIHQYLCGVDTCLFCLGISVRKVPGESRYREIHLTYPLVAARALNSESPDSSFVYLSGAGAKRTSRIMWARVKAEAEEKLLALELPKCRCVRPGYIHPLAATGFARWVLGPLLKVAPVIGIQAYDLGRAMLRIGLEDNLTGENRVFENRDIRNVLGS